MTTRDVTPHSAPLATAFRTSQVAEEDTNYWWTMPDGHGKDHWFWYDRIAALTSNLPTSRDYTVTLPPITGTSDFALKPLSRSKGTPAIRMVRAST